MVIELAARGCWVLLSNSTAPLITRLYDRNEDVRSVGLGAHTVSARRAINSKAEKRGPVLEYLITNIPRRDSSDDLNVTGTPTLPWGPDASGASR